MAWDLAGYTYYSTKAEAQKHVKDIKDDVVAFEGGLGWYLHSKKEYARDPIKRIFGF